MQYHIVRLSNEMRVIFRCRMQLNIIEFLIERGEFYNLYGKNAIKHVVVQRFLCKKRMKNYLEC